MNRQRRTAPHGKAITAQARRALDTIVRAPSCMITGPGLPDAATLEAFRTRRRTMADRGTPVFGAYKGLFRVGPEFFEPLSNDELRAWSGE